MRLVHMDVDRDGTHDRCRLGPFSGNLNAVCGPRGSGKTTLLNWLRTIAQERFGATYAHPDPAWNRHRPPMSGTVEFQNQGRQFWISSDRNGRLETRGAVTASGTELSAGQRDAFIGLAAANGASDTEAALDALAQRLGLATPPPVVDDQTELRRRERELQSQLDHLTSKHLNREALQSRARELESELASLSRQFGRYSSHELPYDRARFDERLAVIERELTDVLRHIEDLDRTIADKTAELKLLENGLATVDVGDSYRSQLQQLDDRLNRWRQTLRDLKTHRESIESSATDARLEQQIGDQLSISKSSDPRMAIRSLEAQIQNTRQQLDGLVDRYPTSAGYDYPMGIDRRPNDFAYGSRAVVRDASGRTYLSQQQTPVAVDYGMLPETLRSMQKDLHEVCQQLARHEATSAAETLKQQTLQLKRCEQELLQSVEKLIEERAALLQKIANDYHLSMDQLTLAFGQWCDCSDHPNLQDWLLRDEQTRSTTTTGTDPEARQRLLADIESLKRTRQQAELRADDCKRQLQESSAHYRSLVARTGSRGVDNQDAVRRELEQINADLAELATRERCEAELRDIRNRLSVVPPTPRRDAPFRDRVQQHIVSLMPAGAASISGSRWATGSRWDHHPNAPVEAVRYDLVDGIVRDHDSARDYDNTVRRNGQLHAAAIEVPSSIVRLAQRLAIGEAMAERGQGIVLMLDQNLDNLPVEIQQHAVAHLARVADRNQQIILMTGDEHVADLIRAQQGTVEYLRAHRGVRNHDVNRQLTALANDEEADKWYRPVVDPFPTRRSRSTRSEYYLSERSLIEDLPSIEPSVAARCRALGVDRIGDLLDVDPHWLADNLRLDGVSHASTISWQAKARLLCSVPNLRPFDARVLVGAGVRTPAELADMHPSQLLDRVEQFLATDTGRRILRSGNSYELSRITSWIASAKGGSRRVEATSLRDSVSGSSRSRYDRDYSSSRARTTYRDRDREAVTRQRSDYDRERYERDWDDYAQRNGERDDYYGNGRSSRSSRSSSSSRSGRSSSRSGSRRSSRTYPVTDRYEEQQQRTSRERSGRDRTSRSRRSREEREVRAPRVHSDSVRIADSTTPEVSETRLKFYLELASPVVDAPSIGPRMAARLEEHGIQTVDQLLAADAESLADKLDHRRVDADTIRAWQEQARLVCRIPNLRGHDAQLLVACEVTSPEDLAASEAATVLTQVLEVAQSKEGQRILRGSKDPDLEEVTDWIAWAAQSRTLNAA